MSVTATVFTYNRPRVALESIKSLAGQDPIPRIIVCDDGSNKGSLDILVDGIEELRGEAFIEFATQERPKGKLSKEEMVKRIAQQRRRAVSSFLHGEGDYLLLLDSDVILGPNCLSEALEDYEYLRACNWSGIGGLTFHAIEGRSGLIQIRDKVFSVVSLTGEAHLLVHRSTFSIIGNPFTPEDPEGFADSFFHALHEKSMRVYERTLPPYDVYHVPGDSMIHGGEDSDTPEWVKKSYQTNWVRGGKRPIRTYGLTGRTQL